MDKKKVGKCILFFIFSLVWISTFGQAKYGNEWIVEGQTYYKFKVAQNGMYRIPFSEIKKVGADKSNPSDARIYHRGSIIPINLINGGDLGIFDGSDYLEFYAKKNDGTSDSVLYANKIHQPHQDYNMYSDTAVYFLTFEKNSTPKYWNTFVSSLSNPLSLNPIPWYIQQDEVYFSDLFYEGRPVNTVNKYHSPDYLDGEGFLSPAFSYNITTGAAGTRNVQILTSFLDSSGPLPTMQARLFGESDFERANPDHKLGIAVLPNGGTQRSFKTVIYEGYRKVDVKETLRYKDIGATNTRFIFSANSMPNSDVDRQRIAYVKLNYPRDYRFTRVPPYDVWVNYPTTDSIVRLRFKFKYTASNKGNFLGYDITNNTISRSFYNKDSLNMVVPNYGNNQRMLVLDSASIPTLALNKGQTFKNPNPKDGSTYLIVTHRKLKTAADEWASYRNANGQKCTIVFTTDLYDLFNYGHHHGIAIQKYCQYMYQKADTKPEYLLLLGKGYEYQEVRKSDVLFNRDLVPTIGQPCSDALFVNGIDVNNFLPDKTVTPAMAVGRVSALTNDSALRYLDKVKKYESQDPTPWHKHITHVCAGDAGTVQNEIASNMNKHRDTIMKPFIGAFVTSYYNSVPSSVNLSAVDYLQRLVNNGVYLYTYYGHGSATLLGVEIGKAADLRNDNKFPIMYFNGCNMGNPGTTDVSGVGTRAEDFLLRPDKGAIAWLSHSTTTFTSSLDYQIDKFYQNINRRNYGKSLGKIWQETLADYDRDKNGDTLVRVISNTFILQGDPALQSKHIASPDYALYKDSFSTYPFDAIAKDDSIGFKFPIYNLGKFIRDSFDLRLTRTYPDNNVEVKNLRLPAIANRKSFLFYMKNNQSFKVDGANKLKVEIDPEYKLGESIVLNNSNEWVFNLVGNGVRLLSPLNYSIVGDTSRAFYLQSKDLLDTTSTITIQLDTSKYFSNKNLYLLSITRQSSSLITWHPFREPKLRRLVQSMLAKNDTLVFYWRARMNGKKGEEVEWDTRSFTYIHGSPEGWNQAHWHQYYEIKPNGMSVDTAGREFRFRNEFQYLDFLSTHLVYRTNMGIKKTGDLTYTAGVCDAAKIVTVEFDGSTLESIPKTEIEGLPSCSPLGYKRIYKQFDLTIPITDTNGIYSNPAKGYVYGADSFVSYINRIPHGNYIALITRGRFQKFSKYPPSVISALKAIGSKSIDILRSDIKYDTLTIWALLGQKDKSGVGNKIVEEYKYIPKPSGGGASTLPPDLSELIKIENIPMKSPFDTGGIISEPIGPSKKWRYAYLVTKPKEFPNTDSTTLYVWGIKNDGTETRLDSTNRGFLILDKISADTFPYLRLEVGMSDNFNKTAAQLRLWQVLYDGIPEGTIYLDKTVSNKKDLLEGDILKMRAKFKNVSRFPMDSLLVNFDWFKNGNKIMKAERITKPLMPDSSVLLAFDTTTNGLKGNYVMQFYANPDFKQEERSLDNNLLRIPFQIRNDNVNPILDVTFDGKHIMDGELISAKPTIVITDKDENKERLLNHPSLIKMYIKRAGSINYDSIPIGSPNIKFTAGTDKENKARIEFRPTDLEDGIHELKVQAKDVAGNVAGKNDYRISFEVINKTMISNFYVYPNPFTTKARFVFTLTGSEVPAYMKVQIMTISGRVVREIKKEELGAIRIGNNISEYAWDGRDEFGDVLSNGLYLYRVIIKDNSGKEIDKYNTAGDKFFAKNFGKLYILR